MKYEFEFKSEPFQEYSESDEYKSFDTESEGIWAWDDDGLRNPYTESGYSRIFSEMETGFSVFGFPNSIIEALRKGLESVAVRLAVTFGFRDENTLTNLVFFARHPELGGRKLAKGDTSFNDLSQEWLKLRSLLVRPALNQQPQTPATPSSANDALSEKQKLYAKLRSLPELTEDQRLFLMLVAYGETEGTWRSTAHNDTPSEVAASGKAWDNKASLRDYLLGCGHGGRAEWAIGSGGYFGRLVPYFGKDMKVIGCVTPRDVFDANLSIVSGILTARALQQWDSWKANPTVGGLRTGWWSPGKMSDPPPERLAKYERHAKEVGLPAGFVSRTLAVFPGTSKARAILAKLNEYSEFDENESFDAESESIWLGEDSHLGSDHEGGYSSIFSEMETEFTFFGFPNSILEALRKGLESVAIKLAVTFGYQDENTLTNLVFFARHPERAGRKLVKGEPGFSNLSQEWLTIREQLVRPTVMAQPSPQDVNTTSDMKQTGLKCNAPSPLSDVSASLGESALGFCSRTLRRYGVPETIQALIHIATEWHLKHPNGPIIVVSDISRCGGGKIWPPHKSHRIGLDVDLGFRINMKSKCDSGTKVCSGEGRRPRTKDYESTWRPLIKELVEIIRNNPYLPVKVIWFKDKELERAFKRPDGTRLISTKEKGHDCHLHVRFCMPERIRSRRILDKVYGAGERRAKYDCG